MADYDPFASDYDTWSAEMTEDVGWYVELAGAAAEPIVELGIGKRRTFERVAAGLRPGGRFAFNVFAFSGAVAAQLEGVRQARGSSWEVPRYVWADSRIDMTRGRGDQEVGTLRLWWVTRSEIEGLIDVAGLEVEDLYGGFHREPYDDSSLEMVWVARKPGGRRLGGAREAELRAPPEAPQ